MPIIHASTTGTAPLTPKGYANEAELHKVLAANPELLVFDDDAPLAVVKSELTLPDAGKADLLLVDGEGKPVMVEVKLAANIQSRREVVAQVLDYASALSAMTVQELDDAVGGKLRESIAALTEDSDASEADRLWRACGAALRGGDPRIVVVVDSAPDELVRIMQFLNDRSDLDVRLVSVEKHAGNGDTTLYVPQRLTQENQRRVRGRSDSVEMAPHFNATVKAYSKLQKPGFELVGNAPKHRQIQCFKATPRIHYEFCSYATRVGVEVHIEHASAKAAVPVLKGLLNKVDTSFPGRTVRWLPNWFSHGRIRVFFKGTEPKAAAKGMQTMIETTYEPLATALGELPVGAPPTSTETGV